MLKWPKFFEFLRNAWVRKWKSEAGASPRFRKFPGPTIRRPGVVKMSTKKGSHSKGHEAAMGNSLRRQAHKEGLDFRV